MMILTLAVLGMVLGSFAVVQPVIAAGPCENLGTDQWGCTNFLCPSGCVFYVCTDPETGEEAASETCP
ncbi:hypothetical protein [Algoriphagus sp. NG3]|uniref:hypothetical protein n=1 Tax=Algoriphagus sp. NG3 TaxID=3097546 RepID=UPI002A82314C|nr:hypothetical protein [Algoriphagus sp. NG3]WPR74636.1 hypothetical protein SLW71_18390 [Algoriphagus sp. NG3]